MERVRLDQHTLEIQLAKELAQQCPLMVLTGGVLDNQVGNPVRIQMTILSIITVVFNDPEGLKKTQQSLINQLTDATEWIIKDGLSRDPGLKNLVEQRRPNIHFLSSPDWGIYDAMHQAFTACKGSYVIFLNAGDELQPNGIKILLKSIEKNPNSIIACSWNEISINESKITRYPRLQDLPHSMSVCHQAVAIPTSTFRILGGYSKLFSLAGDYDFLLRAQLSGVSIVTEESRTPLVNYYRGGATDQNYLRSAIETLTSMYIRNSPEKHKGMKCYLRQLFHYYTGSKFVGITSSIRSGIAACLPNA